MPTQNPRLLLTLKPHQYELVTRLAKAQRKSRAAVFLELFETVTPMLERVASAVEAARQVESQGMASFRDSVDRAEAALLPLVEAAHGQLDLLVNQVARAAPASSMGEVERAASVASSRSPSPRKGRANPRPVTRGSGDTPIGGVRALGAAVAARVKAGPARRAK